VPEIELLGGLYAALGHGQVMDCVKKVGFALAVSAPDAIDVGRKGNFLQLDVAKILNNYFLQNGHTAKLG
jgi:hypothetical protein